MKVHSKLCLAILSLLLHRSAEAVLVSSVRVACPGQTVTFTCTSPTSNIQWSVDPPPGSGLSRADSGFLTPTELNQRDTFGSTGFMFLYVLTDASGGNLTATLTTITEVTSLSGSMVTCRGLTQEGPLTVQVADPPSSPLNPMLGFQNGTNTSVVTLQWTPPTSTGGVDVSYVLTVSPPPVSGSNITTQTSTDITVYYYIQYIVTIRAENCAGSSNGTVVMFELAKKVDAEPTTTTTTSTTTSTTTTLPPMIGAIVGGVVVAILIVVVIVIIIVVVVIFSRRNGMDKKSSNPQTMEVGLTDNSESKNTLQATPQGEYSEQRHVRPKKGSKKKQPPPAESEDCNRITHKQDPAPLMYDELVLHSDNRSQALPGYSQLTTDETAFRESVVYEDMGTQLRKPPVECYIDKNQKTYSTEDVKATKRKAATMPASSSSSYKPAAADKLLNLDQALIQLRPVHSKWKEIAQALRVPITFIEQLEEASSLDASSKMIEITDHWMRECSGKPTWRELADALKTIGEVQLAQQLMQIYKTGRLPAELYMKEVPKLKAPMRSHTSTEADTGPGSSKTVPPRPPKRSSSQIRFPE